MDHCFPEIDGSKLQGEILLEHRRNVTAVLVLREQITSPVNEKEIVFFAI